MPEDFPTYAYEGDQIIAFAGEQPIASGDDFAKVAATADEYFNELRNQRAQKTEEETRKSAKRIETPNGQKGTILSNTKGIWSDEITVRLDNGEIRHFSTFVGDGMKFASSNEAPPASPVEYFEQRIAEVVVPTRDGLINRLNELTEIRRDAGSLITAGVSYDDRQKLHAIALSAEAEKHEVKEALDHLTAVDEAIEAPKMAYTAVEQAPLGHSDSWLEVVAQDMIAESEAQDFDKILSEGPTEFVSSLDNAVIAQAGATQEMARDFIHSKTAGFQGDAVEDYRDKFVAAAELARRRESSYRQDAARDEAQQKEASVSEALDEALFF